MQDPCKIDVERCRHLAAPLGPTQTHMGAYMARRMQTRCIGPTGIVGPRDKMGGGVY